MIQRRTPIARSTKPPKRTPVRKVRSEPRRGEPTDAEKTAIRDQVYEETGGRCELNLSPRHQPQVLPKEGSIFERWHLVHRKAKRVHGWGRENLCGGCYACHIECLHNAGGKPCPPKSA